MARKHFTTAVQTVNLEYVRRAKSGGLELVKVKNGKETVKPVCVTSRIEKGGRRERIVMSLEPRFLNSKLEVF